MKRCLTTVVLLFCTFISTFADRSDYGRDFSDSTGSFFSDNPIGRIIALVIGIILAIIMIAMVYNDDKQPNSDKGCLITFFVILIIIGILCMLV